jgi:hypothetical protein
MGPTITKSLSRLETRLNRIWTTKATTGGLITFGLTTAAFLVILVWPAMKAQPGLSWMNAHAWAVAFQISWPVLLATMYLKFAEILKRIRIVSKTLREKKLRRQLITGHAVKAICAEVYGAVGLPVEINAEVATKARESLLQAMAIAVEETLGMSSNEKVVASLLDFSCGKNGKMRVVCRSHRDRLTGMDHDCEKLVVWESIRHQRIVTVDNVLLDHRWDECPPPSYRAVAAVPVTYNGKAYGGISLDTLTPYAFGVKSTDIAVQLEPYAAAIALTYNPNSNHQECNYAPRATN